MDKMKRIKIAEGNVEIRETKFHYEFFTDNKNVFVVIHHPGKKGGFTEFMRNDKVNLKTDMDISLENNGLFREVSK
jgi:hypothetical protein